MESTYNHKTKQTLDISSTTKITSRKERQKLISEMAYYLAEEREFKGEYQLDDWLKAEAKINHIYGPVN